MTGLDTKVLVRYIVRDDPIQTRAADDLIEGQPDAPAFINHIVLCEIVWVLRKACECEKDLIV